jgi:hypothetical protein
MKNNKLKQNNKPKVYEDTEVIKIKKKPQLVNEKTKVKPTKFIEEIDEEDLIAYEKMLRE